MSLQKPPAFIGMIVLVDVFLLGCKILETAQGNLTDVSYAVRDKMLQPPDSISC